jgi:hypothetical protein
MSEPLNEYKMKNSVHLWGNEGEKTAQIPGETIPGESDDTGWLEGNHLFIPPPNFVNLAGPTTQKTLGLVRGIPGPYARHVEFIGSYHIAEIEYAIQHALSEKCEMERYIRIATTPDGSGGFCLLFQCMETKDHSAWMCLKPERPER